MSELETDIGDMAAPVNTTSETDLSTATRDNVVPTSALESPELIHAQIPKYTPPQRTQSMTEDGQRRPSSSYATGGSIEIPQAVFPPARTLSSSSQTASGVQEEVKREVLPAVEEEPVVIKQETLNSPIEADIKTLSSLKHEHASRTHSPLRESSLVPTTETSPHPSMKKRPPPTKKKGTATAKKRAPTKKRKVDVKRPGKGTPVPSSPSHSVDYDEDDDSEVDSDEDVEGSGDVYCLCRKPDNGTFMIGCDGGCDDWFHGKCVHIEERDKSLIDKYICPRCTQAGIGRTSWKRMCRRPSCRQPARVGKNAGKNGETSKYCSDECGVLFFRQMTSQGRGDHRRRKPGVAEAAKGGVLAIGEIKAMLDQTNTAQEFRDLGNGVLSPPATPTAEPAEEELTALEKEAVDKLLAHKESARQRHQMLKDRLSFITMVKNKAGETAAEKELKPKEYCGFDPRLEWSEEEFAEWRQSPEGQKVFEQDTVDPQDVCSRKKCARHTEWSKLMVDDVRFEMTDNSDRMRDLEQQERDVRDRAAVRAKAQKFGIDEGHVVLHGETNGEAMDVDP